MKEILSYSYKTRITFSNAVRTHNVLLRCIPAQEAFQRSMTEVFCIGECFWHNEQRDGVGNRIISGGTTAEHESLEYSCEGTMEMDTYCIPDATPHPMFSFPSALTVPTGDIMALMPGLSGVFLDDVLAIAHSVFSEITYIPGCTTMQTTAAETLAQCKGVCQDYAHLMIALCRAAGFPARYVCGLMMGEGETHAWVEVHDGQCWYAFDPTNDTAIASGYIKIAHGRDALDCPVIRGIYQGCCIETSETKVVVGKL